MVMAYINRLTEGQRAYAEKEYKSRGWELLADLGVFLFLFNHTRI